MKNSKKTKKLLAAISCLAMIANVETTQNNKIYAMMNESEIDPQKETEAEENGENINLIETPPADETPQTAIKKTKHTQDPTTNGTINIIQPTAPRITNTSNLHEKPDEGYDPALTARGWRAGLNVSSKMPKYFQAKVIYKGMHSQPMEKKIEDELELGKLMTCKYLNEGELAGPEGNFEKTKLAETPIIILWKDFATKRLSKAVQIALALLSNKWIIETKRGIIAVDETAIFKELEEEGKTTTYYTSDELRRLYDSVNSHPDIGKTLIHDIAGVCYGSRNQDASAIITQLRIALVLKAIKDKMNERTMLEKGLLGVAAVGGASLIGKYIYEKYTNKKNMPNPKGGNARNNREKERQHSKMPEKQDTKTGPDTGITLESEKTTRKAKTTPLPSN